MINEQSILATACNMALDWMIQARQRGLSDSQMLDLAAEVCGKDHVMTVIMRRMIAGETPSAIVASANAHRSMSIL